MEVSVVVSSRSSKDIVAAAQDRYGKHPSFPNGRLRNYCTYTKVDLEARGEIERVRSSGAQRLRRTVSPARPAETDGTR
ncbi:DUF6958 family protein [Nakamurella sp. GG22]